MSKSTITNESCMDCSVSARIIGSQAPFGDVLSMDSSFNETNCFNAVIQGNEAEDSHDVDVLRFHQP